MKNFIVSILLIFCFLQNAMPCGPGFITPIFQYKHAPENPYENFAAGKIGILKPTYRRVVLFAAYRYLNNGSFTADEQKGLVDVWNAEFRNESFADDDVAGAVKAWIEKRKDVVGKEEKLPEIYADREYGSYDFFPNCTKNAFETATLVLSERTASYGSDDKDVKAWVAAQDMVFENCASGKQTPEAPNASMPEWLQKDRAYQIAASEFYALDYDKARDRFREIAQDASSPWQETADYLVGRTLIRQASLTKDVGREIQFYAEAEQHLQTVAAKSAKFGDSAEKLLGLIKYRLRPQERVGELARNLSHTGTRNFRQDLIDYNWLLDKFEKDALEAEEKRKEELNPKNANSNLKGANTTFAPMIPDASNTVTTIGATPTPGIPDANSLKQQISQKNDDELEIYLYTDDYAQNWRIRINADATDEEALAEAERVIGRPLTDKMKERFLNSKKSLYSSRFSQNMKSEYQGGYWGEEKTSLSLLPAYLRQDDLTDWLFTFQIQNTEAYLYSLSRFKQTNSDLWLLTALSKADKSSSELARLLEAAGKVGFSSPAYPTVAYHTSRLLIEQKKINRSQKNA